MKLNLYKNTILINLFILFVLSTNIFAQGNSCATAVPVTNLTGSVCATAVPSGVSTLNAAAGCVNGTLDTWFSFVAQGGSATITVSNAIAGWRPEFVVLSSSTNACITTFNQVACVDQTGNYTSINSTINGLVVGQTYWIVVTSNGDLTTGTINTCVNNPLVVASCVDNDACADRAIITLNAPGGGPACVSDCNNGANPGLDFVGTVCEDMPFPTVWYQFTTGPQTATIDVNLNSAAFSNPEFAIFVGNACGGTTNSWTLLRCLEGNAGVASVTGLTVQANTTYTIAVSDASGDQGNFSLCITQFADASACNTNDLLQVTATSMGSPLTGPFKAGELVTFCYSVTNYQQINCNYIGAFIPSFGNCWDPSSFNAQGMPNIINTPLNVNGVIQPCTPPTCAWTTCANTPAGRWQWFPAGQVTYNVNGYYPAGTPMPGGWYYLSSYDPLTGACAPDPTDPDNTYGDGNFPSCNGTADNFDYTICFTLRVGPVANCNSNSTNCSVSIRTFADGEFGAWASIGCTADQPFLLPNSQRCCLPASQTSVISNIACNAATTGSVDLSISGGQAPYSYQWSNGRTTQDLTGVGAGNYTVTITEDWGCSTTASFTITQPSAVTRSVQTTNINCNNANNGAIDLTVNGGIAPYNFLWSNGATSEDLSGLSAGSYTATIIDNSGCSSTITTTISQPSTLTSSTVAVTNFTCLTQGSVNINVSGGTGPYSYLWSNGATTEDLNGIQGGSYNVTITDANSCTAVNGPDNVQSFGIPSLNLVNSTNVSCSGLNNGTVNISVSSGVTPFSFNWSNGNTTEDISGLTAGVYSVTLSDANSCTSTLSATITQPAALSASNTSSNVNCNANNNGSIDLTVNGGTIGYSYLWNNGATTQDLSALLAGVYTVTITDANSCSTSSTATISQPTALSTNTISVSNSTCLISGSVNIAVNGGTGPYSYLWSNAATTEDINGLSGGTYTVTITDANNCTIVNGPNLVNSIGIPSASLLNTSNVSCNSGNNGSINITVNGGTQPYLFNWNNGASTEDLTNLSAGTYSATITDNTGCVTNINSVIISEPSSISASNSSTNVICNGGLTGAVSLTVSGGTAPYTYLWSNGSTNEDLVNIVAGNYSLTITDANTCVLNFGSVNVSEPSAISITNNSITNAGCGVNDGAINITANGGTGSYSYLWSNASTNEDIAALSAGQYNVTVTDVNGCTSALNNIVLTGASNPNASVQINNEICGQSGTGSINITVNSGTAPFSYLWDNGSTDQNINNLIAGTYLVTITDVSGCTATANGTVITPFNPSLNAGVLPTLAVDTATVWGDFVILNGGSTQVAVNYQWSSFGPGNPNFSTQNTIQTDANPDQEGLYVFVISAESSDGCIQTDSVRVFFEANDPEIPTAFSPNGSGDNNIFQVVNINKTLLVEFKVYNRWGQLIYNDPVEAAWDGTYKGVKQPRDVYLYVIAWKSSSGGNDVVKRGHITLMK